MSNYRFAFRYFSGKILGKFQVKFFKWGVLLPNVVYHIRMYSSLVNIEKKIGINFTEKKLLKMVRILLEISENSLLCILLILKYMEWKLVRLEKLIVVWVLFGKKFPRIFKVNNLFLRIHIFSGKREISEETGQVSTGELFSFISHNQRLEFLGDAVLEFMITSHLYLLVNPKNCEISFQVPK
jgi:hypothetical protein